MATHSIRQFPLHFPSRASPYAITFQLDSIHELLGPLGKAVLHQYDPFWLTTFLNVRVVAGRSPTGRLSTAHVNSNRPCRAHAVLGRGLEKSLSERMFGARQWHGMVYVNKTRLHCVNQMGKIQFKTLATRHGMCELAFTLPPEEGAESGSELQYLSQI